MFLLQAYQFYLHVSHSVLFVIKYLVHEDHGILYVYVFVSRMYVCVCVYIYIYIYIQHVSLLKNYFVTVSFLHSDYLQTIKYTMKPTKNT